jgi:hypothetical protein
MQQIFHLLNLMLLENMGVDQLVVSNDRAAVKATYCYCWRCSSICTLSAGLSSIRNRSKYRLQGFGNKMRRNRRCSQVLHAVPRAEAPLDMFSSTTLHCILPVRRIFNPEKRDRLERYIYTKQEKGHKMRRTLERKVVLARSIIY